MIFRHPKAIKQLLERGEVATLRNYPYKPNTYVRIKIIQGGKTRYYKGYIWNVIENPNDAILSLYAKVSGFDNSVEWLLEAIKLHGKKPRYLVYLWLVE